MIISCLKWKIVHFLGSTSKKPSWKNTKCPWAVSNPCLSLIGQLLYIPGMAPTPLLAKGNGTLARKWRKIKKRCSSFSSGDALQPRSKATADPHQHDPYDHHEDEGIAIGEPNATLNTDASKFRHLRDKLQQWNSDLKKRRSSQVKLKTTAVYIIICFVKQFRMSKCSLVISGWCNKIEKALLST